LYSRSGLKPVDTWGPDLARHLYEHLAAGPGAGAGRARPGRGTRPERDPGSPARVAREHPRAEHHDEDCGDGVPRQPQLLSVETHAAKLRGSA
jgi:hypothetical protein